MKRGIALLALLAFCSGGSLVWAKGQSEKAGSAKQIPEVYIWPTIGTVTATGSVPAVYEKVQKYIMDKVGVKPVGYALDQYAPEFSTKLNLALSSGDPKVDIFTGDWSQYRDAIVPINKLMETYGPNLKKDFSELSWKGVSDTEGNIWGAPRLGVMGQTAFTWYQKELFEQAGVKIPTTFEEIEPAMTAIRKVNPKAVILADTLGNMELTWVGAFLKQGRSRWLDASGVLQLPETDPAYRDFITLMADWYKKGYWHPETFVKHDDNEIIKTGNVAIWPGWYSRITIWVERLRAAGFDRNYVFTPNLTSRNGLVSTNNVSFSAAIMISKRSTVPEAAMKLMNWQYDQSSPENVVTAVYGVQGEDWQWKDNQKYFVSMLKPKPEYFGEFMCATGLATDVIYAPFNAEQMRHYLHIKDYVSKFDNAKMPFDYTVTYDGKAVQNNVPESADVNRMLGEEKVKFIMGARPMSEWSAFLADLKKAGYDKMMAEYTRQYNLATKKK